MPEIFNRRHQIISKEAYKLWQKTGRPDLDNWLQAEHELNHFTPRAVGVFEVLAKPADPAKED